MNNHSGLLLIIMKFIVKANYKSLVIMIILTRPEIYLTREYSYFINTIYKYSIAKSIQTQFLFFLF